jgi:putative DNA primase/helicase
MKDRHLKAALWYAQNVNWHVIPLHEPLFGADGRCCGCTCEEWRRSEKHRQWLIQRGQEFRFEPDYVCGTPGKHPRISAWEEKATTDAGQISRWWGSWPTANIGIAAGKSGIVCLDLDLYQEAAGEFALIPDEQETITNLTGGGGQHLIFQHPADGDKINNADRSLPDWVNVRAHGGLFIAPPSMHKSGRLYEWEGGYGPHETTPAALPEKLRKLLQDGAAGNGRRFQLPAEKVTPGKRHQTLLAAGGALRNMGFSGGVILAALQALNSEQFTQPKTTDEIENIVEWILKKPAGKLPGNNVTISVEAKPA